MNSEENKIVRRRIWTDSEIESLVKQWQSSGMSRKAFCIAKELNYYTFGDWCAKHGLKGKRNSKAKKPAPDFLQVIPALQPMTSSPLMTIRYPDNRSIDFYAQPEMQLLKTILGF